VPIVLLINFLVGLAMAFQAAAQLKRFGANLLVADLIGISVCRELGPLMTAIIISGRSGAAFAAGLGVMQVNGEIDALRTLGFQPMRYLVLPRTLALLIVAPLLTILADVAGVLGGLVVGVLSLDLTVRGYLNQTTRVVTLWDLSSGVLKSVVFALFIALIACQQGLATTGGAEGVGRRTTSAVVLTLFSLILTDALLTIVFRLAGT
jgi:phospholipid/cholesterol/gamma-HCH transport system permease protein